MGSKRKGDRLPPFVALTYNMLNSKAYIELTPSAKGLLPYFLAKVKISFNDPERYSTTFTFTFPEANKYGFANATFSTAYRDLFKKGFIDIFALGGLRGDRKSANKYKLSRRWEDYEPKEKKITSSVFVAKKDTTTIINERLAIYRRDFKNGNEKQEKNHATTSKMEMNDA